MKLGIIGSGMIGLSAANELCSNHEVWVIEKNQDIGGLISSFKFEGKYDLDKFYRHIYHGDQKLIRFLEELGLEKDINWFHSKMGIFYKGKMHGFGKPMELLKFKGWSLLDKLRFAIATLKIARLKDWKRLENIPAEVYLRKIVGKRVYETLWRPLLVSKFGDDYKTVPMSWFWNKIVYRMGTRKKLAKEEQAYLLGSFQKIVDKIVDKVEKNNGKVLSNSEIKEIKEKDGKISIKIKNKNYLFDKVIFTPAVPILKNITKGLSPDYVKNLEKIRYQGVIVGVLSLKNSFMPYYWLNILDQNSPFVMLMEHTNFVPRRYYGGKNILYISRYISTKDELYNKSDKEILKTFTNYLKKINPAFKEDWINKNYLFKSEYGTHSPGLNYSRDIPSMKTPIKNLYLATGCQIYPVDRGMSESIALGKKIAKFIFEE